MTRLKVGIFTLAGIGLLVLVSVLINNRPYWWRPCQFVKINVEDATGLKTKSPIRSLGIEIGFLRSVNLSETHVSLGICITAPVEVLPTTRAYLRPEGFLGDKFVELKPVRYTGPKPSEPEEFDNAKNAESKNDTKSTIKSAVKSATKSEIKSQIKSKLKGLQSFLAIIPSAYAEEPSPSARSVGEPIGSPTSLPKQRTRKRAEREIPVGEEVQDIEHLVNRVDDLVNQVSGLANNLKTAINPEDLKKTMRQLNSTLENASRTLAPEGGLTQTAQRTLAKLEDSIEQLRSQMTRVNKGEGSVGRLLNDPEYAELIHQALLNLNRLLNKLNNFRFVVDLGGALLPAYNGGRGWFQLGVWPRKDRYYLIGISMDPRGRISTTQVTTTAGGLSQTTEVQTVDQTSILLTGMLGKVYYDRYDLSIGFLYGDGAASAAIRLGPTGFEEQLTFRSDVYFRTSGSSLDSRLSLTFFPIQNLYLRAGLESLRKLPVNNRYAYFLSAGITFDDDDIKFLLSLK